LSRQDEPSLATQVTDHYDLSADIDDLAGHGPVEVGGSTLGSLTRRAGPTSLGIGCARWVGARAGIGAIGRVTRRPQPRLGGRCRRDRRDRRDPRNRRNPRNRRGWRSPSHWRGRRNRRDSRWGRYRPNRRGPSYLRDLRGLLGLEYRGLE
jgi:hypothetical protein